MTSETSAVGARSRPLILVADDEESVRRFIVLILQNNGYDTREVCNGNEAISAIREGDAAFDLVLMDLVMPEYEGIETILDLRRSHPGLKIIAISGSAGGAFLSSARHLGAVDSISKPFGIDELLDKVQFHLQRGQSDGAHA